MPVEVIGLEVQQNGDPRPELVDVLELERGQLADDELLGLDLAVQLCERAPDIPGDGRAEDEAEPLRRRRLAVRAGDAQDRVREQPRGELDLAPDWQPAAPRLDDERRLTRHARALDEDPDPVEQRELAVVAELAVGTHDLHPATLERGRGRASRPRQAENEDAFRQLVQRKPRK